MAAGQAVIRWVGVIAFLVASLVASPSAAAQARPTATQQVHLDAFGGLTGAETGLNRNLAITAGVDLGLRIPSWFHPSIEVRGTYPVDGGGAGIRQRSLLVGLRVERPYGRLHPYIDLLAGRNQTNFDHGYVAASGTQYFVQSVSTVISPGIGVDVDLSESFGLRLDAQLQRYDSPVSPSGILYAKPATVALLYRFGRGRVR